MSNSSDTLPMAQKALPEIDPEKRRRSRIKLVAIFAIFAIPLLLASIYLHLVRTSGGSIGDTSRGQLISPAVPITEFTLNANDGEFNLDTLRGTWTLLYMPQGDCLETCERNLYHMRQVRLALNHRMDRVQRAVLIQSTDQIKPELLEQHPGLIAATGGESERAVLADQIIKAQQGMELLEEPIYLIDPLGNIMLRFPSDLQPESMLKDIKHLLKVSRIG